MLNPIVSCTVYAFEMLITYTFFSRIAEKSMSTLRLILAGLLLFELGSVCNLAFRNNLAVNILVHVAVSAGFGFWCFQLRPVHAVCYSVILAVINFALELVSVLAISALAGTELADYNNNFALLAVECSASKIFFFLTCLILSNVVVPNNRWSKYQLSLLFFPAASSICLGIFWYICLQEVPAAVQYLLAVSSVLIFSSTVLLFIIYQHQVEMDSERIRMRSENQRLQTEKSYYDILEQQNQQLMVYAHDTKKHLAAIQALNSDPNIERYITALSDQLRSYTSNCHSGNRMLDIIINKYVLECEHRKIAFQYYVKSCNLRHIADIDLVAILGNLMDNALTAAEQSEERRVCLETTKRNGYHVIVLSNTCDTAPATHAGRLITDKEDRRLHGYGLKSVEKTLKKYHGDYSWEYDAPEHTFLVTVMVGD